MILPYRLITSDSYLFVFYYVFSQNLTQLPNFLTVALIQMFPVLSRNE
jgi:hypothetical protein